MIKSSTDFLLRRIIMRKDQRLSRAVHVLIHMAKMSKPVTSEDIAQMIDTNPVVVRRIFKGLKESGVIHSVKGHGGGLSLQVPLEEITLLDVFKSIGDIELFHLGWADHDEHCAIELSVNNKLDESINEARNLLLDRFSEVTLDTLVTKKK